MVPPFWGKKCPFCQKIKTIFLEAFIVAHLFLDICWEVIGVWVNQKNTFDWDIFMENITYFFCISCYISVLCIRIKVKLVVPRCRSMDGTLIPAITNLTILQSILMWFFSNVIFSYVKHRKHVFCTPVICF